MGGGEDRGEGLGIGICVGMGIGNDKVGRGVGNGVGCEGGQDMGQSNDPNPIFEGDFHPMPSGWAETKLSSRHGDEEHAVVVPQPAAPFIGKTKSKKCSLREPPRDRKYWSRYYIHARVRGPLPFHEGCHSEARLPGAKASGD